MTASEAAALDPQLRMLMEVTFECLENGNFYLLRPYVCSNTYTAGRPIENLVGSDTSVFVGSSSQGWYLQVFLSNNCSQRGLCAYISRHCSS